MSASGETFPDRLAARACDIDTALSARLKALPRDPVADAMRHACTGGKRLRGYLVLEGAALFDVRCPMPAAMAIEALHAYSLVHDDLPAMDDDALRRGLPTVHVAWDEATAILAGDALQALAFACVTDLRALPERSLALVAGLARAGGAMVMGQSRDIAAEGRTLTLDEITELQRLKTGALFHWAATAGPVLAGASPRPLAAYAEALGLAFQIADDILDVTGSADRAGKAVGKDRAAGKATFVSHLGLEGARARAEALVAQAEAALAEYGPRAAGLKAAARFAIDRDS